MSCYRSFWKPNWLKIEINSLWPKYPVLTLVLLYWYSSDFLFLFIHSFNKILCASNRHFINSVLLGDLSFNTLLDRKIQVILTLTYVNIRTSYFWTYALTMCKLTTCPTRCNSADFPWDTLKPSFKFEILLTKHMNYNSATSTFWLITGL